MRVTVLWFGPLRDLRGRGGSETLDLVGPERLDALFARLFPGLALPVAYARNAVAVPGHTLAEDGDEIAFLPPVGGG